MRTITITKVEGENENVSHFFEIGRKSNIKKKKKTSLNIINSKLNSKNKMQQQVRILIIIIINKANQNDENLLNST